MKYVKGQHVVLHTEPSKDEEVGKIIDVTNEAIASFECYGQYIIDSDISSPELVYRYPYFIDQRIYVGPAWHTDNVKNQFVSYYEDNDLGNGQIDMKPIMPLAYTTDGEDNEVQVFADLRFELLCVAYNKKVIYTEPFPVAAENALENEDFSSITDKAFEVIEKYQPISVDTGVITIKPVSEDIYQTSIVVDNFISLKDIYFVKSAYGNYLVMDPDIDLNHNMLPSICDRILDFMIQNEKMPDDYDIDR